MTDHESNCVTTSSPPLDADALTADVLEILNRAVAVERSIASLKGRLKRVEALSIGHSWDMAMTDAKRQRKALTDLARIPSEVTVHRLKAAIDQRDLSPGERDALALKLARAAEHHQRVDDAITWALSPVDESAKERLKILCRRG